MKLSQIAIDERVAREREAHTERDVLAENLRIKQRFPHLHDYPSKRRFMAVFDAHIANVEGKTVLDYGCGRGVLSLRLLENGAAKVHGIDISPVYVADAHERATAAGFAPERFAFHAMDAHQLDFDDNQFDLVAGLGILHHLEPDVALREIYRVLKPGGRVLLHEPLADNPLLKAFRLLTPNARTEDEAPFTGKDLDHLMQRHPWMSEMVYCGILEAPVSMVTSVVMSRRKDNVLLRTADRIERWLHHKERLLSWNQYVLFNLVKPTEPE